MSGCIRSQVVKERSSADIYRVKPCAFQENIFGVGSHSAFRTAEYPGDAQGIFLTITDHHVIFAKLPLFSIECNEWCVLWEVLYNYFFLLYLIGIECM